MAWLCMTLWAQRVCCICTVFLLSFLDIFVVLLKRLRSAVVFGIFVYLFLRSAVVVCNNMCKQVCMCATCVLMQLAWPTNVANSQAFSEMRWRTAHSTRRTQRHGHANWLFSAVRFAYTCNGETSWRGGLSCVTKPPYSSAKHLGHLTCATKL